MNQVIDRKIITMGTIDLQNLKVFLERVPLKGSEVLEFARILDSLHNAKIDEKAGDIDG